MDISGSSFHLSNMKDQPPRSIEDIQLSIDHNSVDGVDGKRRTAEALRNYAQELLRYCADNNLDAEKFRITLSRDGENKYQVKVTKRGWWHANEVG